MKILPGALKTVGALAALRGMALAFMFGQNILLLKGLVLSEIGEYYLLSTISYLGNAAIFVGTDLYLQRRLADTLRSGIFSGRGVLNYFFVTAVVGGAIVLFGAVGYFWFRAHFAWQVPIACVFMSVAIYASGISRNLLQLAGQAKSVAMVSLTEAMLKFVTVSTVIALGGNSGLQVVVAVSLGSMLAALVAVYLIVRKIRADSNERYLDNIHILIGAVIPVGGTGLLNWAQLQGYRPLTIAFAGADVIGAVAFLSSLGSTVANAAYGILAQMQIPRVYASKGRSSSNYLKITAVLALALSLLSIPAGFIFLHAAQHQNLLPFLFLVPVGVLIESGNAFIGIAVAHANANGRTFWHFSLCGAVGCLITLGMLLFPVAVISAQAQIAAALLIGQLLATVLACVFTFTGHYKFSA